MQVDRGIKVRPFHCLKACLSLHPVYMLTGSSFTVENLEELLASCSIKPVVNQILLHPYVIGRTEKLLEFHAQQHIVTEAYSALYPLTSQPGGPVDKPVNKIAEKHGVKAEQILLAWIKAKQCVAPSLF